MPAPDVVAVEHPAVERPVLVHLHARFVLPEELAGGVVVMIDNLRASVTMTSALTAGATRVIPVLTVEDALAARDRLAKAGATPLLGGERGGVLIPGFDLDNSPRAYTPDKVRGRTLIFTTVNGTAALIQSRHAARVLIGSFVNLSAIAAQIAADPRPVHILCCGTREEVGLDDVLPAGALVDILLQSGRQLASDDSSRLARLAWRGAAGSSGGLQAAMLNSRGGRGLVRIGLDADLAVCAAVDSIPIVPEFNPATGEIRIV